jgi:hypothetical protein
MGRAFRRREDEGDDAESPRLVRLDQRRAIAGDLLPERGLACRILAQRRQARVQMIAKSLGRHAH